MEKNDFNRIKIATDTLIGQRQFAQAAQQLEQEIASAALEGRSAQDLAPQLDRLAQLKREAAEIHLRCIAQVRQTLPPEQYARLLALAQPAAR